MMRHVLLTVSLFTMAACGALENNEENNMRNGQNSGDLNLAQDERALAFTLPEDALVDAEEVDQAEEYILPPYPTKQRVSLVCGHKRQPIMPYEASGSEELSSAEGVEKEEPFIGRHDLSRPKFLVKAIIDIELESYEGDVASKEKHRLYYSCRGKAHLIVRKVEDSGTYVLKASVHTIRRKKIYAGETKFTGSQEDVTLVMKKVSDSSGNKDIDIIWEGDGSAECPATGWACPEIYAPVTCQVEFTTESGKKIAKEVQAENECYFKQKLQLMACQLKAVKTQKVGCSRPDFSGDDSSTGND